MSNNKVQREISGRDLIIIYQDLDAIVSAALIKEHTQKNEEGIFLQTLFNRQDIITALKTIATKYLNSEFRNVYLINLSKYMKRGTLYLEMLSTGEIKYNGDLYFYDSRMNFIENNERFGNLEFKEMVVTENRAPVSQYLSEKYNIPIPFEMIQFLMGKYTSRDLTNIRLISDVFAYDVRTSIALEAFVRKHVLGKKTMKDVPPIYTFDNFKYLIDDYKYVKRMIESGEIDSLVKTVGDIIILDRTSIESRVGDKTICNSLLSKFKKAKMAMVTYNDYRNTCICVRRSLTLDEDPNTFIRVSRICAQLSLHCRGLYSYYSPDEIIEKIKSSDKWAAFFGLNEVVENVYE